MNEYKIVRIGRRMKDTESMLCNLAVDGWDVVCSYACNNEYIILKRERRIYG